MERQEHGFLYQRKIAEKFGLKEIEGYTDCYDAISDSGEFYQIKATKFGSSIDMGDFFRNMNKKENFYLVVGFWKGDTSNIVEEHVLYIDVKKYNEIMFFDRADELKEWIKNVSNERSLDAQWKKEKSQWKEAYGKRLVVLRFKRDHKSQRRIQCAINNKDFYSYFVKEFGFNGQK
jgi:hypothetical protein